MKTRIGITKGVAAIVAALALATTQASAIIINDRPVGIALGQTLRLNFLNMGQESGVIIRYRLLDAEGNVLAQSERPLFLPMGNIVSVDLNRDALTAKSNRIEIRAQVSIGDPNDRDVRRSTEVFNNADGRTTVFMFDDPGQ